MPRPVAISPSLAPASRQRPRFPLVEPAKASVLSLRYALPAPAPVCGGVLTHDGRLLRAIVQAELPAGEHALVWDGHDGVGMPAPPGSYTLRLEAGGRVLAVRTVTLR